MSGYYGGEYLPTLPPRPRPPAKNTIKYNLREVAPSDKAALPVDQTVSALDRMIRTLVHSAKADGNVLDWDSFSLGIVQSAGSARVIDIQIQANRSI